MAPMTTCAPVALCNAAVLPIAAVALSEECLGGVEGEARCAGISKRKMKAKVSRRRQAAFKGKLCKYFFSSRGCKKGGDCEFAHGKEDLAGQDSPCDSPAGRQLSKFSMSSSLLSCDDGSTACGESAGGRSPPCAALDSQSDFGQSEEAYGWDQGDRSPCHYGLNFGGVVAKLRTRNTFLEFEEEEEEPLAMVGVRRLARATSAPASVREDLAGKSSPCDSPTGLQLSKLSMSSMASCESTASTESQAAALDSQSDFGLSEEAYCWEQGERWPELGTPVSAGATGGEAVGC